MASSHQQVESTLREELQVLYCACTNLCSEDALRTHPCHLISFVPRKKRNSGETIDRVVNLCISFEDGKLIVMSIAESSLAE